MTFRELVISLSLLAAGFVGGAWMGSKALADVEREGLRQRLANAIEDHRKARLEADELKKEIKDMHDQWERERRLRPFRYDPVNPATLCEPFNNHRFVDHTTWGAP